MTELENINVEGLQVLMTPERLKRQWPASNAAQASVERARRAINDVLNRDDHRLLVVVGPCS
ncbi:MAG: 3-deoxy-7-phosphoheptulonate synthase, partial [Gammaproteobacteria bacterium]|nr:3-deoxy-7-phosphoheptulonate synthase [Gammaproteobacteria bacterium]